MDLIRLVWRLRRRSVFFERGYCPLRSGACEAMMGRADRYTVPSRRSRALAASADGKLMDK